LVCDSAMALGARWARESAESWVAVWAPALARESAVASAAAMRQGTLRLRGRLRRRQRTWFSAPASELALAMLRVLAMLGRLAPGLGLGSAPSLGAACAEARVLG
jgi:hypothetical protein